ncbi:restriction endonuclease subunit S [Microbulbifer sp. SSSA007]|uniref:restriction endonuclease subunit S n=1 Tax=Microbulbifer sp. SSSA007 TaxID=3243379 RepID=UPI004039A1FC
MVPRGWLNGQVKDFLFLQRGFDLTKKDAIDGNIPVISSSGFAYFHNESKVKGPGIVTGRKGSVGPVYLINEDFWPHDTTLWVKDFKGNNIKYIEYFLKYLRLERLDEASSVPTLNRNNVHGIKCVFPPLPEQKKIAQILSTWDKAIDTTEELLANSRQQKKALMQQLLTGKKCTSHFSGKFTRYHLSDLTKIDSRSLNSKTATDLEFEYISLSDVEPGRISKDLEKYKFGESPSRARRKVQQGDILLSTVRPNLQGFARITEQHNNCIASTGFAVLTPKINAHSDYIYHYLFSAHITGQINALVVGTNYPAINSSDVAGLCIYCPSLEEQKKIAAILNNCDLEIETLQQKLDYLKQEKKALMQQLLTGKRRVQIEEVQ